jgi:multiple sugar transport system substrate-binding protein
MGRAATGTSRVLIAVALAAAGCRDTGTRATERVVTVRVLLPASERPSWAPIAARFAQEHPGARLELIEGPESTDLRRDLLTASLLARDPTFDLLYMDVTWTGTFAAAGWLRPLDRDLAPSELAGLLPAALDAGRYAGHLYRIPVRTDYGLLYYRRDLLSAAHLPPPGTFDELVSDARRLQSPPARWGFVWQGKQYEGLVCDYLETLSACGGFWIDPGTLTVGLDRPEATRALTFLTDCVRGAAISPPGVTTYEEEEGRRLFQDGRVVFLRSWPYVWSLAQSPDSRVAGRIDATTMVHAPGHAPASTMGGWGLGISAYSSHPTLAEGLIRIVISPEGQRWLCASTGFAPARRDAYDDPSLLAANPFLPRLQSISEHAVVRPVVARYPEASDILQRHLSAALVGDEPPSEALARAAAETRRLLGSGRVVR